MLILLSYNGVGNAGRGLNLTADLTLSNVKNAWKDATIRLHGFVMVNFILWNLRYVCGPGSSVGIATAYGLDGPGIESRWGRDFPHLSRPAQGPIQSPVQWVPGLSRG